MVEVLQVFFEEQKRAAKFPGGRPPKLSVENRMLMTLEYLRKYRTYAHIGISYGLSETRTFENIRFEKLNNKMFSSERVANEHVIGMVKCFKIVADLYRNRRKIFGLRFNLITGVCNFELQN